MRQLFVDCKGAKLVTAPKGSMCFWDSRLIHSNTCRLATPTPEEHRVHGVGGFSRLGFYVCMLPRNEEWDEHRRKIMAGNVAMTNHWPDLNMRAQHLAYPRAPTLLPLSSAALPFNASFRSLYAHML